jgi:hypothetical protein
MKKNKRMKYSDGGGVKLTKSFKNINASLTHYQDNNRTSTSVSTKTPRTSVDIKREKFSNSPPSKKISIKRRIGKNFELDFSKHDKNKSVGLQYTKRFK